MKRDWARNFRRVLRRYSALYASDPFLLLLIRRAIQTNVGRNYVAAVNHMLYVSRVPLTRAMANVWGLTSQQFERGMLRRTNDSIGNAVLRQRRLRQLYSSAVKAGKGKEFLRRNYFATNIDSVGRVRASLPGEDAVAEHKANDEDDIAELDFTGEMIYSPKGSRISSPSSDSVSSASSPFVLPPDNSPPESRILRGIAPSRNVDETYEYHKRASQQLPAGGPLRGVTPDSAYTTPSRPASSAMIPPAAFAAFQAHVHRRLLESRRRQQERRPPTPEAISTDRRYGSYNVGRRDQQANEGPRVPAAQDQGVANAGFLFGGTVPAEWTTPRRELDAGYWTAPRWPRTPADNIRPTTPAMSDVADRWTPARSVQRRLESERHRVLAAPAFPQGAARQRFHATPAEIDFDTPGLSSADESSGSEWRPGDSSGYSSGYETQGRGSYHFIGSGNYTLEKKGHPMNLVYDLIGPVTPAWPKLDKLTLTDWDRVKLVAFLYINGVPPDLISRVGVRLFNDKSSKMRINSSTSLSHWHTLLDGFVKKKPFALKIYARDLHSGRNVYCDGRVAGYSKLPRHPDLDRPIAELEREARFAIIDRKRKLLDEKMEKTRQKLPKRQFLPRRHFTGSGQYRLTTPKRRRSRSSGPPSANTRSRRSQSTPPPPPTPPPPVTPVNPDAGGIHWTGGVGNEPVHVQWADHYQPPPTV